MPADVISISSAEEDRDPSEADCSSEGSADDESSSEEEASASSETVPDRRLQNWRSSKLPILNLLNQFETDDSKLTG